MENILWGLNREALIFTKFLRGRPMFFRGRSIFFLDVFRGKCNSRQSSGVRGKVNRSSNAIPLVIPYHNGKSERAHYHFKFTFIFRSSRMKFSFPKSFSVLNTTISAIPS